MNDEQIKIFMSVAETGSFSKSGEIGYISKQAMLSQINQLEREIGFPLFRRSRTGTVLTESGRMFYSGMKKLLDDREQLLLSCRNLSGAARVLRVGNVEHQVLLTPVTQEFAKQYPDIQIQHVIHPNHSGEWRVENGIQDVAETFFSDVIQNAGFSYTPLTRVPYAAAMGERHPLSQREAVSFEELSSFPTMIFPIMIGTAYTQEIRSAFRGKESRLIERGDVDNQVTAAYECTDSDKILVTANPFIRAVDHLVKIPLAAGWTQEYGIIYREPMSLAVRLYVDLAKKIYR